MKIKTSYVPHHSEAYLTPDKEYEVIEGMDDELVHIIGDNGERVMALIPGCAHIDMRAWDVVEND